MARIQRQSARGLTLEALRTDLACGRWQGRMPGLRALAMEIGVSVPTVAAALAQLAKEGLLERQGARKCYQVSCHDNFPEK